MRSLSSILFRPLSQKMSAFAFNTAFYRWSLSGDVPQEFSLILRNPWAGPVPGPTVDFALPVRDWGCEDIGAARSAQMHGFSWLRDLRVAGGDANRRLARDMIDGWIRHYGMWDNSGWRTDVTGMRLAHWITLYDFFGVSAGEAFQERFFASLIRQARHLSRAVPGSATGLALLYAIRGLVFSGIVFKGHENRLMQGMDLLEAEAGKQILSDGGHISRSPTQLAEALRVYVDIRDALKAASYPVPEQMTHTIDRMAQALRFFRFTDRKFGLFQGAQEGDIADIDTILTQSNARGKILQSLPQSGYERLTSGATVVMMDTGCPPAWPHDLAAHAAPLAFEVMHNKRRIFVSCGAHPSDPEWQGLLRGTAAHSTVTIDDRNACEIKSDGHFGRRARKVSVVREERDAAILLDAVHDGYVSLNGITHRRRLYLGEQGHDFRGEETLTCTTGLAASLPVALRFHIHPAVHVSLVRDGTEAILKLSGGGAGWRFVHGGGRLFLEDSIYLGEGSRPRKTKQLVIHAVMDADTALIKWALQREG